MTRPTLISDGPLNQERFAHDTSLLTDITDLMFHDTNDVKPFSSFTDQLTEDRNQRGVARLFAGIAGDYRSATEGAVTHFRLLTDVEVEIDCASATFENGDWVGPVEQSSGTALENQKVKKVTDSSQAIGYVTQRYGSATTRVRCRLRARMSPHDIRPPGGFVGGFANVETLTGNKTLVSGDARIQVLDPGGAGRDLVLPANGSIGEQPFFIHNSADAAEILTIKNAAAATVCTPTQNESAIVFWDGAAWRGIVGANN